MCELEPILTPRQLQVVKLIMNGYMNKQITTKLKIKKTTLNYHITVISKKFGINNSRGLLKAMIKCRYIETIQDLKEMTNE